jgi:FlaA1/EpsC-like NDP-sugar epimerase
VGVNRGWDILVHLLFSVSKKLTKRRIVWMLVDSAIVIASYTIAFFIRTLADTDQFINSLWFVAAAVLLNIIMLGLAGTYQRLWRFTSGSGVRVLIIPSLVSLVVLGTLNLMLPERPLPSSVILLGQFASLVLFVGVRYRSRLIRGLSWRWEAVWNQQFPVATNRDRVLVIGAGSSGQLFVSHSSHVSPAKRDYEVVGFADDDSTKQGMLIEDKPVLGQTPDVPSIVRDYSIDRIILAIHNIDGAKLRNIVDLCYGTGAEVKLMPDVLRPGSNQIAFNLRDIRIEDLIGRASLYDDRYIDLMVLEGRTILITGAAGSVGSELSRQLAQCKPKRLLLLDNNESGLYDLLGELKRTAGTSAEQLIPVLCDVTQQVPLESVFRKYTPDVVFHAAAYKHVPLLEAHPSEAIRINLGGTYNVAQLSQQYEAERFVLISTDKAVNSTSVMGATKYLCEQIVRSLSTIKHDSETLMTAVRFGNVLGSRGSVVPLFERQIREGGPVTVTDERMTRYFMSIPEAAHLVIQAGCMTRGGDLFVLEMGESVRIVELAERMIRLHNLRPYIDISIDFIGIRPGETLHEKLIIPGEERHPTAHPYVSTYTSPEIDSHFTLNSLQQLLTTHTELTDNQLKQSVITLAHEVQVNYSQQQASQHTKQLEKSTS